MSSWLCAYCARRDRCPLYGRVRGKCPYFVPASPERPAWERYAEKHDPYPSIARRARRVLDP